MFTLTARLKLFRYTRRYRPSIPPTAIITVSFAQFKMSSEEDGYLWSFGYGSNMDVTALQAKKHVKIKEHTAAILKDWKLSFMPGIPLTEPGYANLAQSPGSEVHGVAFLMSKESQEELDRTERSYAKVFVDLTSYDGRPLKGFVYYNAKASGEGVPSARYLGVLVKGARQAKLNEDYIGNLEKRATYTAPSHILELRSRRPDPASLPTVTVEEMAAHADGDDVWTGALGYVVRPKAIFFSSHKGRDLTTRMLMQFHGIPLDDNDDRGRPPYPLEKNLSVDEVEYVTRWLDYYQANRSEDGVSNLGEIVGYLAEYREQQESGESDFKLPPIPT